MTEYRTEENLSIITVNIVNIIIVSLLLAFLFTNIYFLVFIFLQIKIDITISLVGAGIFCGLFLGNLLIQTEFFFAIKNEYKSRPPLQMLVIIVTAYLILFFITPDRFMNDNKLSLPVLTLLIIPSIISGLIMQQISFTLFALLIKFISRVTTKDILGKGEFEEKLSFKIEEISRHEGIFSIVLFTITIPPFSESRIKRSLTFTLFFEILRKNIRKTDILGIFDNGKTAILLSNGNNLEKTRTQANRLIGLLENNQLFMKKLRVFNSKIKASITEAKKDGTGHELLEKAFAALKIACESDKEQVCVAES
ncbi:MAG: hypothetical protein JW881_04670 [Spirochaetales bacterium]|nr:hypothetical protein [Spirochaetales bacterium]